MGIRIHDLEPADGSNKRGKRKAQSIICDIRHDIVSSFGNFRGRLCLGRL